MISRITKLENVNVCSRTPIKKLMRNPEGKRFQEMEAVLPTGLMLFLTNRPLADMKGEHADIVTSYWEYYDELVGIQFFYLSSRAIIDYEQWKWRQEQIPLNRSHQAKSPHF